MKGLIAVAGTVIVGALNTGGKERLNLQQVMVVTPRTAEVMGLSYETLFTAVTLKHWLPHGSPILVKLSNEVNPVLPTYGAVGYIALDKAAPAPEKNAFVRT